MRHEDKPRFDIFDGIRDLSDEDALSLAEQAGADPQTLMEAKRQVVQADQGSAEPDLMGSDLGFSSISHDSDLYDRLTGHWFSGEDEMLQQVRAAYDDGTDLYFTHGIGYDWISMDLLGGTADGQAQKAFWQGASFADYQQQVQQEEAQRDWAMQAVGLDDYTTGLTR